MLKHDYVLRLIEQLARFVGRLIAKTREEPAAVAAASDDALRKLAGLDLATVRTLPLPALLGLLRRGTEVDPGRTLVVAELLHVQSVADDAVGECDLADSERLRALALYLECFLRFRDDALTDSIDRAEALIEAMRGRALPPEVLQRLALYFERTGRYARAEDAVFELAEIEPETAGSLGLPLFDRLLALDDDALEKGALPRDEVEAARAELEERTGA